MIPKRVLQEDQPMPFQLSSIPPRKPFDVRKVFLKDGTIIHGKPGGPTINRCQIFKMPDLPAEPEPTDKA